jgi:hypothetical protein
MPRTHATPLTSDTATFGDFVGEAGAREPGTQRAAGDALWVRRASACRGAGGPSMSVPVQRMNARRRPIGPGTARARSRPAGPVSPGTVSPGRRRHLVRHRRPILRCVTRRHGMCARTQWLRQGSGGHWHPSVTQMVVAPRDRRVRYPALGGHRGQQADNAAWLRACDTAGPTTSLRHGNRRGINHLAGTTQPTTHRQSPSSAMMRPLATASLRAW